MASYHPNPLRVLAADDEQAILGVYRQVFAPTKNPSEIDRGMETLEDKLFGTKVDGKVSQAFDLVTCRQAEEVVCAVKTALDEKQGFAVAFLDVRMPPGPDGVWAAERVRALDPDIEIVIVTGFADALPEEIARRVPPAHKLL
ncbi:MAG: hypothetical protein JSW39_03570 [Desulfobacterales bacterium]|nr:MAG: hypothetical protein JSW39_03570 [Desulfobacterales bacterium]